MKNKNLKYKSFSERIKTYALVGLSLAIFIYLGFELKAYIVGPVLKIYSPLPYQSISGETFEIKGNVKNVKAISINGRDIKISKEGDFDETLITKQPYTLVIIKVTGRYGEEKTQVLNVGVKD